MVGGREYGCLPLGLSAAPCSETSLVPRTDLRHLCLSLTMPGLLSFSCNINTGGRMLGVVSPWPGKGLKLCVPAGLPGRKV